MLIKKEKNIDRVECVMRDLNAVAKKEKKAILQRFFKTGDGDYGEGDVFIGVMVPDQRKIAKKYRALELEEVLKLLHADIHGYRLTALFIIIDQYERGDAELKKRIFDSYLASTKHINNWDLVDLSASKIIGDYLINKPRDILYKLAKSKYLWERRIAILATYIFIKNGEFDDVLLLAEILLKDDHDLIQKAVGWMLREIGKRDEKVLLGFLNKYYKTMPRTMLRYSIEKLGVNDKKYYMK